MKSLSKSFVILAVVLIALGASGAAAHFLIPGGILHLLGAAASQEPYGCPMVEDAEVRSEGPGKCPKCGMDLVPLSQTEHKGKIPAGKDRERPPPAPVPEAQPARKAPAGEKGKLMYHCPMHPTYISDRPGDCPICNMKLVPMEEEAAAEPSSVEGLATVKIRPEGRQLIGVLTGAVERRKVVKTIRAAGRVEYSEKALSAVSLKVGGWVEELFLKSTGDAVKVGDPLFSLYSPELLEAQRSYLLALEMVKARGSGPSGAFGSSLDQSLRSARERLLLWDIAEEQLREIESKGEPRTRMTFASKTGGVVIERNIVQGTYVEPGKDLYRIADLSTVWVQADIYEHEISRVKAGAPAEVALTAFPGESVAGQVSYVYPYLNQETRTVRVRIELPNPEGKLKPGMYGAVSIIVDLGQELVIDDQAILDSGIRRIAFVETGEGRFEPREVKTGERADGLVVVLEGLKEGEKVVTSGNFLIDAESRLKAALLEGARGGAHKH